MFVVFELVYFPGFCDFSFAWDIGFVNPLNFCLSLTTIKLNVFWIYPQLQRSMLPDSILCL